jgi:hypothetical protein
LRLATIESPPPIADKAHGWIDEAVGDENSNMSWAERVEFQTLRREARELRIEKPGVR